MNNKTALITGASSGIGCEFAKILAARRYRTILVARREVLLLKLAGFLEREFEIRPIILVKDLSSPKAAEEIFEELKQRNIQIDVLINNAGFGDYGNFVESSRERINQMIGLNIKSLTELTHRFLPGMIKRKYGKVLNVSSLAAFQPGPMMAVYYASKAYVLSFSEAISEELNGSGVTVSALCPGPTESEFQKVAFLEGSRLFLPKNLPSSREVAEYGFKAMMAGKVVAIPGIGLKLAAFLVRLTPRALVRRAVKMLNRKVA